MEGVAVSTVALGFGRVRSAWRDSLVRGPRPLACALGLVAAPGRSFSAVLPGPGPSHLPPSGPRKPSLSVPSLPREPRALGTRDPLSGEGREGAGRGGEGRGHLQTGRSCRSVAGVGHGKSSALQMSEPESC